MVIVDGTIRNVLNRIFLVGIANSGKIPMLYSQAINALNSLDKTIASTNASAVNNAPFAWKRDKMLVLVVGNLMFSYRRKTARNGDVVVIVEEVAQNGKILTETKPNISRIISETIDRYLEKYLYRR